MMINIKSEQDLQLRLETILADIDAGWYVESANIIHSTSDIDHVAVSVHLRKEPNNVFDLYYRTELSKLDDLTGKLSNAKFYRELITFFKARPAVAATDFLVNEDGTGYFRTVDRAINLENYKIKNYQFVDDTNVPSELNSLAETLFGAEETTKMTL